MTECVCVCLLCSMPAWWKMKSITWPPGTLYRVTWAFMHSRSIIPKLWSFWPEWPTQLKTGKRLYCCSGCPWSRFVNTCRLVPRRFLTIKFPVSFLEWISTWYFYPYWISFLAGFLFKCKWIYASVCQRAMRAMPKSRETSLLQITCCQNNARQRTVWMGLIKVDNTRVSCKWQKCNTMTS